MNIHNKGRLTPIGREHLVQSVLSGQTPEAAARAAGVCPQTAKKKWLARFQAEGGGWAFRSLAAAASAASSNGDRGRGADRNPSSPTLYRLHIARDLGVSPATVSRALRRLGVNRIAALEPAAQVRRNERERPGELIHIDI